jgi:hypothetical protein
MEYYTMNGAAKQFIEGSWAAYRFSARAQRGATVVQPSSC